jgi:hypothetical protein
MVNLRNSDSRIGPDPTPAVKGCSANAAHIRQSGSYKTARARYGACKTVRARFWPWLSGESQ